MGKVYTFSKMLIWWLSFYVLAPTERSPCCEKIKYSFHWNQPEASGDLNEVVDDGDVIDSAGVVCATGYSKAKQILLFF